MLTPNIVYQADVTKNIDNEKRVYIVFLILVLSTKKRHSSFLKNIFFFRKICFKVPNLFQNLFLLILK